MPRTHRYTFTPKQPHRRIIRAFTGTIAILKEAAAAIRQASAHKDQWQKLANRLDSRAKRLKRMGRSAGEEADAG